MSSALAACGSAGDLSVSTEVEETSSTDAPPIGSPTPAAPVDVAGTFRLNVTSTTADVAGTGTVIVGPACLTFLDDSREDTPPEGVVLGLPDSRVRHDGPDQVVFDNGGGPIVITSGDRVTVGGGVRVLSSNEVEWATPPGPGCPDTALLAPNVGLASE